MAIDGSGTYAASSALDSFIRVWNLEETSTKAVMETPPSETWQICFHPTADTLTIAAAGGSSNSVALWNCDTAQKAEQDLLKIPGVRPHCRCSFALMEGLFTPISGCARVRRRPRRRSLCSALPTAQTASD